VLREGDRDRLADLARLPSVPPGLGQTGPDGAADGMPNAEIARVAGVSRPTVMAGVAGTSRAGIRALEDEPRTKLSEVLCIPGPATPGIRSSLTQPPDRPLITRHCLARDRFATLDPPTAHQGFGAYEEDGGGAVISSGRTTGNGHRSQ
jgi:hypothetical protein